MIQSVLWVLSIDDLYSVDASESLWRTSLAAFRHVYQLTKNILWRRNIKKSLPETCSSSRPRCRDWRGILAQKLSFDHCRQWSGGDLYLGQGRYELYSWSRLETDLRIDSEGKGSWSAIYLGQDWREEGGDHKVGAVQGQVCPTDVHPENSRVQLSKSLKMMIK